MDKQNTGNICISDEVVAVIAGLTAHKTKGIVSMSGGVAEGWAKRVSGKNVTKGVSVEVGQVETAIDLRIIVEYGVPIQEVCETLQKEVKEAVENMTGLRVIEVNIKVEGVELKDTTKKEEEEHRVQ